jgi:hypothetical protein
MCFGYQLLSIGLLCKFIHLNRKFIPINSSLGGTWASGMVSKPKFHNRIDKSGILARIFPKPFEASNAFRDNVLKLLG